MFEEDKNLLLKEKVIERARDTSFKHHKWFVEYHLDIVQHIAEELCDLYPVADRHYVFALAWLHDYEKIIDFDNQYNTELIATRKIMEEVGYTSDAIEDMAHSINLYNAKEDLASARIEIQIVSSSDAASHLVGPFFALYWYENSDKSIEELQAAGKRKQEVDWEKKITLPEVKKAFECRHQVAQELTGNLPKKYLS